MDNTVRGKQKCGEINMSQGQLVHQQSHREGPRIEPAQRTNRLNHRTDINAKNSCKFYKKILPVPLSKHSVSVI